MFVCCFCFFKKKKKDGWKHKTDNNQLYIKQIIVYNQ